MSGKWVVSHSVDAKLVEKQMRNWELARGQRLAGSDTPPREVQPFVTISRQAGSGGRELAAALGETLGWPVFDRQILQSMAGDDTIRHRVYQSLDERDLGWFEESLRAFMQSEFVRNDYFRRLGETVLSLARQGSAIFVGRGIDLVLPRTVGLRLQIVAPLEKRVEWWCAAHDTTPAVARQDLESMDEERASFIRRHFGADHVEPTRFDLTVNVEHMNRAQAVDIVLAAVRTKLGVPTGA